MGRARLGMVISSWDRPCGVAEYGRSLVKALERRGLPVAVLALPPAQAAAHARALGIARLHFQYEYNLYETEELCATVAGLAREGIESVVTLHSWDPAAHENNRRLREEVPRFIVTLPALRSAMQRGGIDPSRVAVIPIGIPRYALPPRPVARAALGLGGEPAVGFFGFFHRHKGVENLGLAVRELRRRYPGLRGFLFASVAPNDGSRRAFEAVRQFFDAHGLWEGVTLQEGYLPEEEVVRRLHAMDANVLPYAELPGLQASAAARTVLAALRPTVATDTTHFSDLGDEVVKIPDNRPERIAAAVAGLLDDPEASRRLVERTVGLVGRVGWDQVAEAHLHYYLGVLRVPPGGPARRLQAWVKV